MFAQYSAPNTCGKANENQAGESPKGQNQLSRHADAIECADAHAAVFGKASPAFVIPKIKRQQKIKLLRKAA